MLNAKIKVQNEKLKFKKYFLTIFLYPRLHNFNLAFFVGLWVA